MDDIVMPAAFPSVEFHRFGIAAGVGFALIDQLEKRRQFTRSWQAVRYRYRLCTESNEEFGKLVAEHRTDEETTYKLERCMYMFFMGGLSIFESFGFCLYFVANKLRPDDFPDVANPGKISLKETSKAFSAAFAEAEITKCLSELISKSEFKKIAKIRNLMAHRVSGRVIVRTKGISNGKRSEAAKRETIWQFPQVPDTLLFDGHTLQQHLDVITAMLTSLTFSAREFAETTVSTRQLPT